MDFEATLIELIKHLKACNINDVGMPKNSPFAIKLKEWVNSKIEIAATIISNKNIPNSPECMSYCGILFVLS